VLHMLLFCLCELNFESTIESTSIIYLPCMCCLWSPKADKILAFLCDYVVQEGKHHSSVVSIKKQEWFANTSVINSKSVEILEHLSQKGGGNAGFWGSPIKAGDVCFL
jgi:hypothetical protein